MTCNLCHAEIGDASSNEYFLNDEDGTSVELKGFVQYDEEPQEVINLDSQDEEKSQNIVNLEKMQKQNDLKLKTPQKVAAKSLVNKKKLQADQDEAAELQTASKFSQMEYWVKPVSASYGAKTGKFSFGTSYDSSLDSSQLKYSTGFYTKYDGKHFAISSQLSRNTQFDYDSYNDKIYVAPELKLTKRLSLVDIIQSDLSQANRKNEVVVRYTPHFKKYADDVQLELGAGQSFYENQYLNSSIRFSTRFKL